jgi:hypothetical protein
MGPSKPVRDTEASNDLIVKFDDQRRIENEWLALTHDIAASTDGTCVCRPSAAGARWSGYLGAAYASSRVLFVGANHNGGDTGLLKTPQMARYNERLAAWSAIPRSSNGDRELLETMRDAYSSSWPRWGSVWGIFGDIRTRLKVADDAFAFVNLARCPNPRAEDAWNNVAIGSCQEGFPLRDFVQAIDARVIFLAKGGEVGRKTVIPDEIELSELAEPLDLHRRLVIRYDNGSYGSRRQAGKTEHWKKWVPSEVPRIRVFLEQRRRHIKEE